MTPNHGYTSNPEERLIVLLEESDAVLVRDRKHLIYKLGNGRTLTVSKTCSDKYRGALRSISDLKRLMK
jgi:hypothetical protein